METWILPVVLILYVVLTDALDWAGRYEYMQTHFPRLIKWAGKKEFRLLLLFIAIGMLGRVLWEQHSVKEPEDSLRRRTMQLADEIEKYFLTRANDANRPPFAAPNSEIPEPTEEQKEAIERYRKYEQESVDFYFAHYKDRMIGIIKEYNAKGVQTRYLESNVSQRPPVFFLQGTAAEGTYMDDLYQFRELAYHVDGQGNLIVITP